MVLVGDGAGGVAVGDDGVFALECGFNEGFDVLGAVGGVEEQFGCGCGGVWGSSRTWRARLPRSVPPGSRVSVWGKPRSVSSLLRLRASVVLPEPSTPSIATKRGMLNELRDPSRFFTARLWRSVRATRRSRRAGVAVVVNDVSVSRFELIDFLEALVRESGLSPLDQFDGLELVVGFDGEELGEDLDAGGANAVFAHGHISFACRVGLRKMACSGWAAGAGVVLLRFGAVMWSVLSCEVGLLWVLVWRLRLGVSG